MSWESYETAAEKGPGALILKVLILILGLSILVGSVGYGLGWFSDAAQVAKEEFGPKAMRDKYTWFIQQAESIKKMDQDITNFEARLKSIEDKYAKYGKPENWRPDISTMYNHESQVAKDDVNAVISQRNNLVKEYRAQSKNFLWKNFEKETNRPPQDFAEISPK